MKVFRESSLLTRHFVLYTKFGLNEHNILFVIIKMIIIALPADVNIFVVI